MAWLSMLASPLAVQDHLRQPPLERLEILAGDLLQTGHVLCARSGPRLLLSKIWKQNNFSYIAIQVNTLNTQTGK